MGCLFAKLGFGRRHETLEEEAPKEYSWSKRPKLDRSEYMFEDLTGQTVGKLPGKVQNGQFIVQNCKDCNIYLFEYFNSIMVDDCVNCTFFIGPIQTSIFIRDTSNCKFVLACQQFRLRDCQKLDVFLCCDTIPIIESSSGIKLACYSYYYPQLEAQFKEAKLSVYNNNWSSIHDFTQDRDESHFTLLPVDSKVEDFIPKPVGEEFQSLEIDLDPAKSVVPLTSGARRKTSDESCLLVFFYDGGSHDRVKTFLNTMKTNHSEFVLVQTKELDMKPDDARRVFETDSYSEVVLQGSVIGLEYNGDGSIEQCQEIVTTITKGTTGMVFVSQNKQVAEQQIDSFYNFADMQMSV